MNMPKTRQLRLVLGDQLTRGLASLTDLDPAQDVVLMVEVAAEAQYVPHHKQKIAFLLSAMRHFAQALEARWREPFTRLGEARDADVLGQAQEAWLYRNLDQSRAHWKVLAQQIMVMDLDRKEGPEPGYNLDSWAGYSIPRQRLLDRLRERGDPTVPFSLAMEAATNPFVRAGSVAELARRRAAKDAFRG